MIIHPGFCEGVGAKQDFEDGAESSRQKKHWEFFWGGEGGWPISLDPHQIGPDSLKSMV